MNEPAQSHPAGNFSQDLGQWADKRFLWLSKHWLTVVNTFFFIYVGLPFLAPILLANGYTSNANTIYWLYRLACHQLPSRAFFIAGEQVAICHRCAAIYGALVMAGLLFNLVRHSLKPLAPRWYIFFLLPMALDGGMGLVSELRQFVPMGVLWASGLAVMGIIGIVLYKQNYLTWHTYLLFSFGLLALIYLQLFGPYTSNIYLRLITGFMVGVGTVWFAYPTLEEGFYDIQEEVSVKLTG